MVWILFGIFLCCGTQVTAFKEVDCQVSAWTAWAECKFNNGDRCGFGTKARSRVITVNPTFFGADCPVLAETAGCGERNGGCDHHCISATGICVCNSGYKVVDLKRCVDADECLRSADNRCAQTCINTPGSYECGCYAGYYKAADGFTCVAQPCGRPRVPDCPPDSHSDSFGSVCAKASVSCPGGEVFAQTCQFGCPSGYALAKIVDKTRPFGRDFLKADFVNVFSAVKCAVLVNGNIGWENVNEYQDYYCRRTNDPPSDILLSNQIILEYTPLNSDVGVVSAVDGQPGTQFVYTVENSPGQSFFAMRGDRLQNTFLPDLKLSPATSYSVKIRATDNGVPPMLLEKSFVIAIKDVNDPPRSIELSPNTISNVALPGATVGTLSAIDDDSKYGSSRTSDLIWSLDDDAGGRFRLNSSLVILGQQVTPSQRVYQITVKATDRNVEDPKSVTAALFINVIDVKTSPRNLSLTLVALREDLPVGSVVGRAFAADRDGEDIIFDLSLSDVSVSGTFQVGPSSCSLVNILSSNEKRCTADISLTSALDFEQTSVYQLRVKACDESKNCVVEAFSATVIDENEAPMDIHLLNARIVENSQSGAAAGQIKVVDPDQDQSHSCAVMNASPFEVRGLELVLKVGQRLDYELAQSYLVNISCVDMPATGAGLSASREFTVAVVDVNEPPTDILLTKQEVPENAPIGTVVGVLSAQDPDLPLQTFTFSLQNHGAGLFVLAGHGNSSLVVAKQLDFESSPEIQVTIRAVDQGGEYMEKLFRISVIDVNEPPTDISLSGMVKFSENAAEGQFVANIVVTDPDQGDPANCQVVQSSNFKVVGTTLLSGPQSFDFEALRPTKTVTIQLRCADSKGLSVSKSFDIPVADVNEKPTKISLTPLRQLRENEANVLIQEIQVDDPDVGQRHECEAVGGSSSAVNFGVSRIDGKLLLNVKKALNFEERHAVVVTLLCWDGQPGGTSNNSISADFFIDILDVNEAPGHPCPSPILVSRSASLGSVLLQFSATDPDNEEYDVLRASGDLAALPKQKLAFALLDVATGLPIKLFENFLYVAETLNSSSRSAYSIVVNVSDDGVLERLENGAMVFYKVQSRSVAYTCEIHVVDPSDSRLQVHMALSSNVVKADSSALTIIGSFTIVNGGPTSDYTFTVLNGDRQPFMTQQYSLVMSRAYNFGTALEIAITVQAKNQSGSVVQKQFVLAISGAKSCDGLYEASASGGCVCRGGRQGHLCDREPALCQNSVCAVGEVCVTLIDSKQRCIEKSKQVFMLLPLPYSQYMSSDRKYQTERYIESIIERKTPPGATLYNPGGAEQRPKRSVSADVYVEDALSESVGSFYTYVRFVVMDVEASYAAMERAAFCSSFNSSDVHCLNEVDCKILVTFGIPCPLTFGPGTKEEQKTSDGGSAVLPNWAVVLICVLCSIIVTLILLLLFARRRRARAAKRQASVSYNFASDAVHAQGYGVVSQEGTPEGSLQLQTAEDIRRMQQMTNMRMFDNQVFQHAHSGLVSIEANNPMYVRGAESRASDLNNPIYASIGDGLNVVQKTNETPCPAYTDLPVLPEKAPLRETRKLDFFAEPPPPYAEQDEPRYSGAPRRPRRSDEEDYTSIEPGSNEEPHGTTRSNYGSLS